MYAAASAAHRCPPGLERFSPHSRESPDLSPRHFSSKRSQHRRQVPPPAGPDLFQGCTMLLVLDCLRPVTVAPPSARHTMGFNHQSPIQHAAVQVTQQAC
ncbi:unnamed protein product [Urochloa humidicola]